MSDKNRLNEFDTMRAIAIVIILFHHLPAYCFNYYDLNNFGINYDLSFINDLNRYFALGIFVYISGYLLLRSSYDVSSWSNVIIFMKRRLLRIMPLYYLALIFYLYYLVPNPIDHLSLLEHILGLQVLLATQNNEPVQTLWFIGLIVSYYMVYIVVKNTLNDNKKALATIIAIPVIALILKITFGIIDKRFFIYYIIFIAGMLVALYPKLLSNNKTLIFSSILFVIFSGVYGYLVYPKLYLNGDSPKLFSAVSFSALVVLTVVMLSLAILLHILSAKLMIKSKSIYNLSYASFCIYLFHRPIWYVMLQLYDSPDPHNRAIYLAGIGVPIIVFLSYFIQRYYDIILKQFRNKKLI